MGYSMNMSDEVAPSRKKLLEEGWRDFVIKSCAPSTSKSGNEMFIMDIMDKKTGYMDKIYPIATPKKRWFLKTILAACGIPASADGVYEWNVSDIVGKEVRGLVEHEPNEYINRNGETVKTMQHKIVEIAPMVEEEWDKNL